MLTNSREIVARLQAEGWRLVRISGSHHHFKKPGVSFLITVPHPKKDLGSGLARKIAKMAGWMV